jgi:ATP-dependent Lon protease
MAHQVQNFVRFCEAVVKHASVKRIKLVTSYDEGAPPDEVNERLDELRQSLLEMDVVLDIEVNPNLHDREIRIDNGWIIKIGRGLDFYQKPTSWFSVGAHDMSLRPCLETKVDIYRVEG